MKLCLLLLALVACVAAVDAAKPCPTHPRFRALRAGSSKGSGSGSGSASQDEEDKDSNPEEKQGDGQLKAKMMKDMMAVGMQNAKERVAKAMKGGMHEMKIEALKSQEKPCQIGHKLGDYPDKLGKVGPHGPGGVVEKAPAG